MSSCKDCGGDMIGDGYTVVEHCENAVEDSYWFNEPDSGPIYCGFEEPDPDEELDFSQKSTRKLADWNLR